MYKLENGILAKAPKAVHHDIEGVEFITTNPTEELLRSLGYKTLVEQEKPEITQYQLITERFTETDDTITKDWEITEKPIILDEEPQEMQEGYELQDYEYVTPTEVHRGKRLVSISEVVEEAPAEEVEEERAEFIGED